MFLLSKELDFTNKYIERQPNDYMVIGLSSFSLNL